MSPLTSALEGLLATVVVIAPGLVAVVLLAAWARRLAPRGGVAFVPVAIAGATAAAGAVVSLTASSGLEGLAEVLVGAYLIGTGLLAALVCMVIVARNRSTSG